MGHEVIEDQGEIFAFLADPATHRLERPDSIKRIDTHGAVVFLAGDNAYKIKRAVLFPFMDFSTLEKRRAACENEITVNRANAPEIYLGTMPIRRSAQGLRLGGADGAIVEWAVHLRRFDETRTLDKVAERGEFDLALIADLAEMIIAAHEHAPRRGDGATALFWRRVDDTLNGLADAQDVFDPPSVLALREHFATAFASNEALLREREGKGKVRRCHGDLHLRNIVLQNGKPILFDAIEFDDSLATVDILYDLAFILMDLWQRGLHAHANLLFNRYLWRCADVEEELAGLSALPLFLAQRAAIRARVMAALAKLDPGRGHGHEARGFFAAARKFLAPQVARLVAIGGLSGSGKSVLAQALAPRVGRAPGAVHLRSDIERKRLCGVAEYEHLPVEAYRVEMTEKVYQRLRTLADIALHTGQSVIVDAVHARPEERDALLKIAAGVGAKFTGFWLDAPVETLVARVEARTHDASDATGAVVQQQSARSLGGLDWVRLDATEPTAALAERAAEKLG